jgi:hypothetical protein
METGENKSILFIKDKSFSNDSLDNYHLSIELSPRSLTYSIIEPNKRRCMLLSSSLYTNQEDLSNIFTKDNYLSEIFLSKSIALVNYPNTLVPEKVFNENDKEKLFSLNHNLDETILTDNIKNNNIINLYSIPKSLHQTIKNIIPDAKISSQSSILINSFLSNNNNIKKLNLYIKDDFVHILITNNNQLIFQNKFEFTSKEDLLFYTLFCIQENNLDNEKINTEIYGDIKKEEYQILYEYIRNINYGNKLKDIDCGNEFNNIDEHCFNILYRQHLCV